MKIEDIKYTLPTEQISEADFDREKWLQNNPVDYFKFLYVLFNATDNAPKNFPCNIAMSVAFELIYHVTRLYYNAFEPFSQMCESGFFSVLKNFEDFSFCRIKMPCSLRLIDGKAKSIFLYQQQGGAICQDCIIISR